MEFESPAGLRRAIVGVCSLLVAALAGGAAVGAWRLHEDTLAKAEQDQTQLTTLAAERTAQAFATVDLALNATRNTLQVLSTSRLSDTSAVNAFLRRTAAGVPQAYALTVLDQSGVPRFTSLPGWPSGTLADKDYFRVHARRGDDELFIDAQSGDSAAGRSLSAYSRRVTRSDGGFDGVVVAFTDQRYRERLFNLVRLDEDIRIRLLSADGSVKLSLPQDVPEAVQMAASDRIVTRRPMPGYPYAIELSGSKAEALAPWRRTAVGIAAGTLVACGTLIGLSALLLRQLRRSEAVEEELRASRALLQLVFDTVPHALYVKDRDGRLMLVNETSARMIGVPVEQLLGRRVDELGPVASVPEEKLSRVQETDAEVLATGKPVEFELERVLPDGVHTMRVIKAPIRDTAGTITALLLLAEDVTGRRKAEEELHHSRALLQLVFDMIPHSLWLKDREGRPVMVNPAGDRMVGQELHQLIGAAPEILFPLEQERRRIRETDLQVMKSGAAGEFEIERELAAGKRKFRVIKVPMRNAAGAVSGVLSLSEDVTEREEAAAKLRESQALLRLIIDTLPQSIHLRDLEGRLLVVNRAMARNWRLPANQLVGRKLQELTPLEQMPAEEQRTILETDAKVMGGEIVEIEADRMLPAGTRRIRSIKVPVRDATGRVTGILTHTEDVTERRQGEEALKRSRALLQAVFDTIPHHLFVKDRKGHFVMVNWGMARAFRMAPEEYIGRAHVNPGPPGHVEAIEKEDASILERGLDSDRMVARSMPDGLVHHYRLIKAPLRDEQGRVTGLVGLAEDMTERVTAEQKRADLEGQLQQAQKMELIGRLSAGVAHDFNNLLTPILGHAELLLSDASIPATGQDSANVILKATERAAELTRGLLAFGRKQVLDMKPLRLNDAVNSLYPILGRLLGKAIEVRLELDPDVAWVEADSSQIQQVLLNLAVNARDAMPEGGLLVIGTRNEVLDAQYAASHPGLPEGRYVMLYVSDSGHGMDADTLRRVFEPFFTTKAVGQGTGLGLSIVHGIVEQHGGTVRVYSKVGQGTTFRVFLPRIEMEPGQAPAAETADAAPVPRGSERILVVDDEEMIRNLMGRVLESHGYDVTEVVGPEEALAMMDAGHAPFALLVTDVIMRGMSGSALYEQAARRMPGLRVLYISGHPRHLVEQLGHQGIGRHFLTKPFPVARLAHAVRQVLDE